MKRRGLLIVGQAPSRNTVGRPALAGKTGDHLARLFGFSRVNEFADAVNVLEHWPGKSGRNKGCLFPMREARGRADQIIELFPNYRCVVLLGRKVSTALGFDLDPLEWQQFEIINPAFVGHLPHPSGVNHWYNVAANRRAARRFCLEAAASAGI